MGFNVKQFTIKLVESQSLIKAGAQEMKESTKLMDENTTLLHKWETSLMTNDLMPNFRHGHPH